MHECAVQNGYMHLLLLRPFAYCVHAPVFPVFCSSRTNLGLQCPEDLVAVVLCLC